MVARKKPGTAVATRARTSGPVVKSPRQEIAQADFVLTELPTTQQVIDAIKEGYKFHVDIENDGSSVLASTLERFVAKGDEATKADLETSSTLDRMQDHLEEWLSIISIDGINNADPGKDGPGTLGVYYVVSYAGKTGELRKMAVGAKTPFGYITALAEADELPCVMRFGKAEKATKGGFYPINVELSETDDLSAF